MYDLIFLRLYVYVWKTQDVTKINEPGQKSNDSQDRLGRSAPTQSPSSQRSMQTRTSHLVESPNENKLNKESRFDLLVTRQTINH